MVYCVESLQWNIVIHQLDMFQDVKTYNLKKIDAPNFKTNTKKATQWTFEEWHWDTNEKEVQFSQGVLYLKLHKEFK